MSAGVIRSLRLEFHIRTIVEFQEAVVNSLITAKRYLVWLDQFIRGHDLEHGCLSVRFAKTF